MARPRKQAKLKPVDLDSKARESQEKLRELVEQNYQFFTPETIKALLAKMDTDKQRRFASLTAKLAELKRRDECRLDFMQFVRTMWPDFHGGRHFDVLADAFHRIDKGEPVRLIVNIAPRRGKSKFVSTLFPSWYLGKHPEKALIQVSNITTLAEKFGGDVRDLMLRPEYQSIFATKLRKDNKSRGQWRTTQQGEYYAAGVGAKIMGRGADVLIIDDPHSEQSITTSGEVDTLPNRSSFESHYNWFTSILPRVEKGGSILIVMQRLAPYDLTGRLIEAMQTGQTADKWEIISIPALEKETTSEGKEIIGHDGQPVWRSTWDFWSTESQLKLKASMPPWKWSAQFMQDPAHDHNSAIKRSYWKHWGLRSDGTLDDDLHRHPPVCDFIIQSWDMAATANTRSNYSACTTWGVFRVRDDEQGKPVYNIILINALRGKWEYPELKKIVIEQYKRYQPNTCIVEKTSVGQAIIPDLTRAGIPIRPYTPTGNQWGLRGDKESRVQAVSDYFHCGFVWVPVLPWVQDVIEEFAMFGTPGANDDYVDSTTQALLRFREGGFIKLPTDKVYEEDESETVAIEYY